MIANICINISKFVGWIGFISSLICFYQFTNMTSLFYVCSFIILNCMMLDLKVDDSYSEPSSHFTLKDRLFKFLKGLRKIERL